MPIPDNTAFLSEFLVAVAELGYCPVCLIGRLKFLEDESLVWCGYCGQTFNDGGCHESDGRK